MTVQFTRLSTIAGVDYLLKTVAAGDVPIANAGRGLVGYYAATGTPPGQWIGSGVTAAGIDPSESITSLGATRLFKDFRHPVTGSQLGAKPRAGGAVAGFDLTFTIPKSVSAVWALADAPTRARIEAAHNAAIAQTMSYFEDRVLQTRSGSGGVAAEATRGVVAGAFHHFDTRDGDPHLHTHVVVANRVQRARDGRWLTIDSRAAYKAAVSLSETHENLLLDELSREQGMTFSERTSRAATTTSAVVLDVDGVPDTLLEAFSSRDQAIRARLAELAAEYRADHSRAPKGRDLAALHQRAWRETRKAKDATPTPIAELRGRWRGQAIAAGIDVRAMVASTLGRATGADVRPRRRTKDQRLVCKLAALTLDQLLARSPERLDEVLAHDANVLGAGQVAAKYAPLVRDSVRATRSTWTSANLRAEVERLTRQVRCPSAQARRELVDAITAAAAGVSVELSHTRYHLTTAQLAEHRLALRGSSVFDDETARVFTDTSILDAETYLRARAHAHQGTHLTREDAARLVAAASSAQLTAKGFGLAEDQAHAARTVLADPAGLSAIVGPAGTGKTTTMRAVRAAWEQVYGAGSVVGMTTSAQAAAVLGAEIDSEAHTIAKWLHETTGAGAARRAEFIEKMNKLLTKPGVSEARRAGARRGLAKVLGRVESWTMRSGQLVIVDEASMSGTHALAELARQAEAAGAKILLVGDPAQLDAVDAGGVLGWLERTGATIALDSVWRFDGEDNKAWEPAASLELREGNTEIIDTYLEHGRVRHGGDEQMLEDAYAAARADQTAGRSTILIASTNAAVADLNQRFTLDRRAAGEVDITSLTALRHGSDAGVGDQIVYRKVDRTLADSRGDFIRNGTPLRVTKITRREIHAVRTDSEKGATFVIPRDELVKHAELGYAITAHRAQGTTVDVGHVVVPSDTSMSRETYYVAMTRGRKNNTSWVGQVDVDESDRERLLAAAEVDSWRTTLERIVSTSGAELTAHETAERWSSEHHSLSRLYAEREHLLSLAETTQGERGRHDLLKRLAMALPADLHERAAASPRLHTLEATVRRLHNAGVDVDELFAAHGADASLHDAKDVTAVLTHRLENYAELAGISRSPDLVQPSTGEPTLDDALTQNADLIEARNAVLRLTACSAAWAAHIDPRLPDRDLVVAAIATYRDRYDVDHPSPLGPRPVDLDRARLAAWVGLARELQNISPPLNVPPLSGATVVPGPATAHEQVPEGPTLG